jgi:hypothetical protein
MRQETSALGICFEGLVIVSFINVIYTFSHKLYTFLDSYYVIIPSLVIKGVEYIVKRSNKEETQEIIKTKLSTIHATLLFVSNVLFLYNYLSLNLWRSVLLYSVIYNGMDMVYLYYSDMKIKKELLFHHFMLITCITPILLDLNIELPTNYYRVVAINFLCEITTIPLNLAWILYAKNNHNTFNFKALSGLTILLYIPFRICLTTYLSYKVLEWESALKYFQFMLTTLNYYWFYKMVQKVVKISKKNNKIK